MFKIKTIVDNIIEFAMKKVEKNNKTVYMIYNNTTGDYANKYSNRFNPWATFNKADVWKSLRAVKRHIKTGSKNLNYEFYKKHCVIIKFNLVPEENEKVNIL